MRTTTERQGFFSETPVHRPAAVASERVLVPEGLLAGDEIVLLAMKPSLWFILRRSGAWVALCALAALALWYMTFHGLEAYKSRLGFQVAIAVALVRVSVTMFQWASRLYVLTNRRVMRVRGILRVDVFESPLNKVQSTCLSITPSERLMRIGTITIHTMAEAGGSVQWEHISQPQTVHTRLRNAIARSHMNGTEA